MNVNASKAALLVLDMQNDFCNQNGVFAKNGFDVSGIEPIIPKIASVMERCKAAQVPTIACKLAILTDLSGRAIGHKPPESRRFVLDEGFRPGSWGIEVIPELPQPDYVFQKWGYSAMYHTELEHILTALGIETVVLTGIATSGIVEGTGRDARAHGIDVVTLSDCVTGYDLALHEASLLSLGSIGQVVESAEFVRSCLSEGGMPIS